MAVVLDILARPGREKDVVPAVLAGLVARGSVSAGGMCLPRRIDEVFRIPRVRFRHRAHSHVPTKHPDLPEASRRGDVHMGGLGGESWSRLATDRFRTAGAPPQSIRRIRPSGGGDTVPSAFRCCSSASTSNMPTIGSRPSRNTLKPSPPSARKELIVTR